MKAFELTTTINPAGEIRLTGVPFTVGTEVEVLISPKRVSAEGFREKWAQFCQALRNLPQVQQIDDAAIGLEITEHRAGR